MPFKIVKISENFTSSDLSHLIIILEVHTYIHLNPYKYNFESSLILISNQWSIINSIAIYSSSSHTAKVG